jgi:sodium/bile acid cotransporter 7
VAVGVLLHSRLYQFAQRYAGPLRSLDQAIILLIVYTSFCESFAQGVFRGYSAGDITWLGAAMLALFFVVYGCILLLSRLVNFNREDTITALFCGSKKSLVQGTVMSKVLFPDARMAGVILLPLMLYHALQILVASIVAQALSRRAENKVELHATM